MLGPSEDLLKEIIKILRRLEKLMKKWRFL